MPRKDSLEEFAISGEELQKILEEEQEKKIEQMDIREYLSIKQLFPYMKDNKLAIKKVSYNIDDSVLKIIDQQLGTEFTTTESEFAFHSLPTVAGCAYISKISENCVSEGQKLLRKTVYMYHPKIYALMEFIQKRFDLDYIYGELCRFLNLTYTCYFSKFPMVFDANEMKYGYGFCDNEMKLGIDEKAKLLGKLFSMINIEDIDDNKLQLYSQRKGIMDIADCNTQMLNDESFRTIMELISNFKNIVTSNDEKYDVSCAKVKVRKIKKSDKNDF